MNFIGFGIYLNYSESKFINFVKLSGLNYVV